MAGKEATARIKINKLLEAAGWRFFAEDGKPANVWRGRVKMNVADPSRRVVDMLSDPALGGGLRPTVDVMRSYFASEKRDDKLLIEYYPMRRSPRVCKTVEASLNDRGAGAYAGTVALSMTFPIS